MTLVACAFEAGTSGGNVTTALEPALATVQANSGSTVTYDTAHVKRGSLACKMAATSGSVQWYLLQSLPLSVSTAVNFRYYAYLTSNFSLQTRFCWINLSNSSTTFSIYYNTAGTLELRNASGTVLTTTTNTHTLNGWHRVEGQVNPGTGAWEVRLYLGSNADGSTADEIKSGTGASLGSTTSSMRLGNNDFISITPTLWVDDIAVSTNGWLGSSTPTILSNAFSGAATLTDVVTSSDDTSAFTTEASEPLGNAPVARTGWFAFQPTISGVWQLDTIGSSFDSALAVYTGTVISSLSLVVSDDSSGGSSNALVSPHLTAGTRYMVQVGSGTGASGVGGTAKVNITLLTSDSGITEDLGAGQVASAGSATGWVYKGRLLSTDDTTGSA